MLPFFGMTAYAAPLDEPEDKPPIAPVTDYPETPPRPFTPSGTGTVTNYATDGDGKEFYTIMTPDEHVFYLVIDRQRSAENVYFLNAVTIADLAALAEIPAPPQGGTIAPLPPVTATEPPPETPPPAEQEQGGGNMGMMIFIAVIVVLGGGAGWYFKIYRPKQQGADADEYEPPVEDETDFDNWDDTDEDGGDPDAPPLDEESEAADE